MAKVGPVQKKKWAQLDQLLFVDQNKVRWSKKIKPHRVQSSFQKSVKTYQNG